MLMRNVRFLTVDLAPARHGLPIGLLILAAAVPGSRLVVLAALVVGFAVACRMDASTRWAWAAPIPVAVNLSWGLLAAPLADPGGGDCVSLGSPPAVWRATEAGLSLVSLALLAFLLRARRLDLGLAWPSQAVVRVAIGGAIMLGPIGLLLGAVLARPFFGAFELDLSQPGFIAPALVFAIANGAMEELAYRGALLGWTSRVTGPGFAVIGQAVVFGLAHGGADVGGPPIVLMLALGFGGFLAGVISLRTRSMLLPIAWHVALDLPLYVYLACRA
jgi:membrane protease YdiL (CAAX protease family)